MSSVLDSLKNRKNRAGSQITHSSSSSAPAATTSSSASSAAAIAIDDDQEERMEQQEVESQDESVSSQKKTTSTAVGEQQKSKKKQQKDGALTSSKPKKPTMLSSQPSNPTTANVRKLDTFFTRRTADKPFIEAVSIESSAVAVGESKARQQSASEEEDVVFVDEEVLMVPSLKESKVLSEAEKDTSVEAIPKLEALEIAASPQAESGVVEVVDVAKVPADVEAAPPSAIVDALKAPAVVDTAKAPVDVEAAPSSALVEAVMAPTAGTKKKASSALKKEMSEDDLVLVKEQIRSAGAKSKEQLIKDIRAVLVSPQTNTERAVTLKLAELAIKAAWRDAPVAGKVWRLKEDVPQEELAAVLAKTEAEAMQAAAKKAAKAAFKTGAIESAVIVAPPAVVVEEKDVKEIAKEAVKEPAMPLVPKELDSKIKELLSQAEKILADSKTLFREIFENVESIRALTVLQDLARKLEGAEEALANREPNADAIKLVSVVISDSRRRTKQELVQALSSLVDGKSSDQVLESWIDLLAKRVDYVDDMWAFEMERKDDAGGKSRRNCMRSAFALVKTLVKLVEKDVYRFPGDKLETVLKESTEKLAKVQREWFNREEKKMAIKNATTAAITTATTTTPPPQPAPAKNTLSRFGFFSSKATTTTCPPLTNASASSTTTITTTENATPLKPSFHARLNVDDDDEDVHERSAKKPRVDENEVEILDESVDLTNKRKRSYNEKRNIALWVDSRLRSKVYVRAKDHEYFGRGSRRVTGRRPFGKSPVLDYEIDSEDEEGESLSDGDLKGDDEEGEEQGLDYKDGWLERDEAAEATAPSDQQQQLVRLVPCVVGVWFGGGSSDSAPAMLSNRNQPFEPQSEDPAVILSKYTIFVRRDAVVVSPPSPLDAVTTTTTTTVAPAEEKPQKKKKVRKPLLANVVQDGAQLQMFVQMIEGSLASRKDLEAELAVGLKKEFPNATPSKAQIAARLTEVADKVNKRWEVKDEVMHSVGLERKIVMGSLSLFEKMTVMRELEKQGVASPSEEQIRLAEREFVKNKLEQETAQKMAAKAAAAKAKAAKAVGMSTTAAVPSTVVGVVASSSSSAAAQ